MGFVLEYGSWYLPIKLEKAVEEDKEKATHFKYGCPDCKKSDLISKSFCLNCNKEIPFKVKLYDKEKEEVGSRDMWDFQEVDISEVVRNSVGFTTHYYIEKREDKKKPKASEIERWKQEREKIGKSLTLQDLYAYLVMESKAIRCKVVFNSKVNIGYIYPNRNLNALVFSVMDGNKKILLPKQPLFVSNEEVLKKIEELERLLARD